eukprot:TRINITY_DN4195_c1_g1_i1.p1 TRINITY_DN4195_c1_g1~~TRINITY_DN4195_c1_g1_i1.p1  ORF type:complete len:411 (+),score=97.02 TRINITY_DN4195_c1_g1_i1:96-1328(+)
MIRALSVAAAVFTAHGARLEDRSEEDSDLLSHGASLLDFDNYRRHFRRNYLAGSDEYERRRGLFEQRREDVRRLNARSQRRWLAGLNEFSDRTDEELSRTFGWQMMPGSPSDGGAWGGAVGASFLELDEVSEPDLPEEVDWRPKLEMASKVPKQGSCGSCWAVTTTVLLQAHYEIHMKEKRSFSIQQLVNCVPNPKQCGGKGGCRGATVQLGLAYVQEYGLVTEEEEPYTQKAGECNQTRPDTLLEESSGPEQVGKATGLAGMRAWNTNPSNKIMPLMASVLDGPVAVSVAATKWHNYHGGIFDDCPQDVVTNHAVLMFGYSKEGDNKYFIMRNSWGDTWGEKGFLRLFRHQTPEEDEKYCGENNEPQKGIACKPYPDSVRVCGMCGMLYNSVVLRIRPSHTSDSLRGSF